MCFYVLVSGLIGGLINLDTYCIGQTMISRPLVSSPILGLILGSLLDFPQEGLQLGTIVGVILELLWLNTYQVGVVIPPNATISSITTTSIVCLGIISQPFNPLEKTTFLILSICFGLIIGLLTKWMDVFLYKKVNITLLHKLENSILTDKLEQINQTILTSIGISFMVSFLIVTLTVTVGLLIINPIKDFLVTKFDLTIMLPLLLLCGSGVAISVFGVRKNIIYFIVSFLITTILWFIYS